MSKDVIGAFIKDDLYWHVAVKQLRYIRRNWVGQVVIAGQDWHGVVEFAGMIE